MTDDPIPGQPIVIQIRCMKCWIDGTFHATVTAKPCDKHGFHYNGEANPVVSLLVREWSMTHEGPIAVLSYRDA